MATTMMPMPPNHCSIERQSSSPSGSASSPENTVEPVVVIPDIASKKASTGRASISPSTKGRAPKNGNAIQIRVVSRKVCWMVSPCPAVLAVASAIELPTTSEITALDRNTAQSALP